jgi:4a-hydroxytetrahydrobiopterin dehydratase
MAETLVEKVCMPCRGAVPPLTREEVERYLDLVRDWGLLGAAQWEDSHRVR